MTAACAAPSPPAGAPGAPPLQGQLPNPASANCIHQGGALSFQKNGAGAAFGVCTFSDNRQCEEWAMFTKECPAGGIRVTGYVTSAARYCAISGGRYAVTANSNTATERGTCTFPNGKTCDALAYYDGECSRR